MLKTESEALMNWLSAEALPLWFERGLDRQRGGFVEKLTPAGGPIDEPRRARVSGRQIFVFSEAERWGWHRQAEVAVRHGLDWLSSAHLRDGGSVIPLVDADKRTLRHDFDLYDHAFVLFGLAAARGTGIGDDRLERLATALRQVMVAGWKHPVAGFEEASPRQLPLKANPHMHMLEASLAWEQCSADPVWRDQADEIIKLCIESFLCPDTGALREFFDGEWKLISAPPDDVVEPGHQAEWAWLLIKWARARGNNSVIAPARRLLQIAEGPGRCGQENLFINELNADLSARDSRMRLWPQTERIKALIALASLAESGDELTEIEEKIAGAISGLMRFFEHPVSGSWWEHIGPDGHPIEEPARASSLYHIVCAASELANYMQQRLICSSVPS